MTQEKKDLTRIEDLEDFLHGDDAFQDEDSTSDDEGFAVSEDDVPPDLPDFSNNEDAFGDAELPSFDSFSDSSQTLEELSPDSDSDSDSDSVETSNFPFADESSVKTLPSQEDLAFPDPSEFQTNSFSFVQEDESPTIETIEPTDIFNQNEDKAFDLPEELITEQEKVNDQAKDSSSSELLHLSSVTAKHIDSTATPIVEETPAQKEKTTSDDNPYKAREDFAEVRSFAEHAVLSDVMADSNPSFSVMAHGIKFVEDSEDIMLVLRELKFPDELMNQFQRQIERGSLLIPRVSEFTAIYLCHKLRRFRLNLQMGLSDLLHAPRGTSEQEKGLVSRRSLGQNQHHHFNFREDPSESRNILLSTLGQLDGHVIEKYLGVASEHAFLDSDQVEEDVSEAINTSYDELAQKLKGHALEQKANAVVGINYQLTPMPSDNPSYGHYRYKLTCTGNLVWVNRLNV